MNVERMEKKNPEKSADFGKFFNDFLRTRRAESCKNYIYIYTAFLLALLCASVPAVTGRNAYLLTPTSYFLS